MEPLAKSVGTQRGDKNYRGVFHLHKDGPEDNSSWARCSLSIKSAPLFKCHLVRCKAGNKTFQKLPRECRSFNSHFSRVTYSTLHAPVHPVLKDLKWCKAEANFKQNQVCKTAGFGTKKINFCSKQLFSSSSPELPGSFYCSQLVISLGSPLQRRCVWVSTGALQQKCAIPCKKRHN